MEPLKLYFVAFFALSLLANFCDNDNKPATGTEVATLYWSGEYAVDGCGFSATIQNKLFKFTNEAAIPAAYKTRQQPVQVKLTYRKEAKQQEFVCNSTKTTSDAITFISAEALP